MAYRSTYTDDPASDWNAHCDNLNDAAQGNPVQNRKTILAGIIESPDQFDDAISDYLLGDYYSEQQRPLRGLTKVEQYKHDRASMFLEALADICTTEPRYLCAAAKVLRSMMLETLEEISIQRERDTT